MEQITLDMIPNGYTPIAHASQYDNGRHIRFNLRNITLDGSESVLMKIRKSDGNSVSKTIENHTSYLEYVSETADCDVAGTANCEIVISKDNAVLGSKNFRMNIEADAYDGAGVVTETASGRIATFETNMIDVLQEVKCEINATGGNGTPDSPIPINGYTEANITRCGVNLFDKTEVMDGYISDANGNYTYSNNRKCTDYIPIKGGESYKILSEQEDSAWGAWYDSEKNYISGCAGYYVGGSTVKTAPANACFVRLTVWSNSSGNIDTFGLNYPATDTAYHAYNGQTYTIAFGQTVYGGVLDVTRGKLHVKWSNAVDLGLLGWSYDVAQQVFVTTDFVGYKNGTPFLCDVYTDLGAVAISQITNCGGTLRGVAFYIKNTDYTDAPTFKTAMSGKYITAELATPFDIDLTPVQVEQLLGKNNVWHDANGDTEVKYLFDA